MELNEYRDWLVNDIKAKAVEEERYPEEVFIEDISNLIIEDLNLCSKIELSYFQNPGNKAFKKMKIDAGSFDLTTNSLNLLITDFNSEEIHELNNEFINNNSQLMINFFENTLKGFFAQANPADPAVQLAKETTTHLDSLYKVHLFIISTNKLSGRVKTFDIPEIIYNRRVFKIELDIIDITKIYNTRMAAEAKEDIVINVKDFGIDGIPCIMANINATNYDAYLAVVPGEFLSDIYKKYGPRLLEGNVRSFLQLRGAVNKGIRGTILNEKEKFFTYNNGISTTAKEIKTELTPDRGLCIKSFTNLQIINGGQTTASLASASIKDREPLDHIFVQMKLTIVKEQDMEFIRNISKYSNSQNKVTAADLNSNHPFYTRIEEYSRKIYAPTINNQTYQTIWFFERSKGQYDQPKMKMTKAEVNKYQRIYPSSQKFDKTDLAKYINSAEMKPFDVSWGKEVNANRFQAELEKQWDKDNTTYNEMYYRDLIAKAIIYNSIRLIVLKLDWYKENKGYLAQIVTYTFSKLIYEISKTKKFMNYKSIWEKQEIPEFLAEEIAKIAKVVSNTLNSPNRTNNNIETYCKSKVCWDAVSEAPYHLPKDVVEFLKDKEDIKVENIQAKKDQKLTNGLSVEIQIFNLGSKYWSNLITMGLQQNVINYNEANLLKEAITYCNTMKALPNFKFQQIWNIRERLAEACIKV